MLGFLVYACSFYGCGAYGFRPSNPPEGIRTLYIPSFQNSSGFSEANIIDNFTIKLKDLITRDNTFLLADEKIADGSVRCTITGVTDEPLVISGNETVTKRKITVTVSASFRNLKKDKEIWNKSISNFGEYNSSNAGFSERDLGVQSAIDKISNDILIELTSNW
ncbi:MAG: LptE family protein [Bacteroidetes bacterium]|nr:LptE family protein [Bacteroidota bacterium]MBX7045573.1 hypothetical protein [Ignavibacteria bacterium]